MPKYGYKCPKCDNLWEQWGKIKDLPPKCSICGADSSYKVPSHVFFINKSAQNEKLQKIGEITKEHIEENREILQKMKENTKNKE